ncbi:MAG TPA: hypothetical protein VI814_04590 [Candidatus Limnocylindria bacterium]
MWPFVGALALFVLLLLLLIGERAFDRGRRHRRLPARTRKPRD